MVAHGQCKISNLIFLCVVKYPGNIQSSKSSSKYFFVCKNTENSNREEGVGERYMLPYFFFSPDDCPPVFLSVSHVEILPESEVIKVPRGY